jgi:signal transduction histidine kinase
VPGIATPLTGGEDAPSDSGLLGEVVARFLDLTGASDDRRLLADEIQLVAGRQFGLPGGHGQVRNRDWAPAVVAAADLLGALILERDWSRDELERVLEPIARTARAELDHVVTLVFVTATRGLAAAATDAAHAIDAATRLLRLCARVHGVAVLERSPAGRLVTVSTIDIDDTSAAVQAAASHVLLDPGGGARPGAGAVQAIHVGGADRLAIGACPSGRPRAALVVRPVEGCEEQVLALAAESAAALAGLLDRADVDGLVARAVEERTRRLSDDLHDGALQSLALLSGEIQLLRSQLRAAVDLADAARLLAGRLEDLLALAVSAQRELRLLTEG